MINYRSYILLMLFLLLTCKKVTDPIEIKEDIQGTWQETFTWIDFYSCIPLEEDYSNCEITQISHLTLNSNTFTVEVTPQTNNTPNDLDYTYSGIYHIEKDTIIFRLNSDSSSQRMFYRYYGDSLEIGVLPEAINDSMLAVQFSSFLWGNAFRKISGVFYRIN
jgi:hypothetical protein